MRRTCNRPYERPCETCGASEGACEGAFGVRDARLLFYESGQMLVNNSESGQMLVNSRHLGTDSFALLTSRGASRAWMLVIYKQTAPRLVRLIHFKREKLFLFKKGRVERVGAPFACKLQASRPDLRPDS